REIYENPNSTYVAARLGQPRINLLPADLFGSGGPEGAVQMGLRPENIKQQTGKEASVVRLEHLGDQTRLHLKLAGHDVVTLVDPHTDIQEGSTIQISASDPLYFDTNGMRIS
ncbi:MAG: TOBE domain-containing protein, partial [Pseudomonadota bacterium]